MKETARPVLDEVLKDGGLTEGQRQEAYQSLQKILGEGGVSRQGADRLATCRDYWPMNNLWFLEGRTAALPDLVAWPSSSHQVAAVLRYATENHIPVTPYGEGSGALGGAIPLKGGILLDMKRMKAITEIAEEDLMCTVEAGVNGARLEKALEEKGYTCGNIPQSLRCSTVGGWAACRAAGQSSTRYGKMEDMIISLDAVTGAGDFISGKKVPRRSAGPRPERLFIGSEGTLGVITALTLRMWPPPALRRLSSFAFPTLTEGLTALRQMLRRGARPAVARLYDPGETNLHFPAEDVPAGHCLLILIVEGDPLLAAPEDEACRQECLARGGAPRGHDPVNHWLKNRFNISIASKLFRQGAVLDTIEVSSSWSRSLPLYNAMAKAISGVEGTLLAGGHFSHFYPEGASLYMTVCGFPPGDKKEYYLKIWEAAMEACLQEGGSISHHHGMGLHRSLWMREENGSALDTLKAIKKLFDPAGIMNPGKLGLGEVGKWQR